MSTPAPASDVLVIGAGTAGTLAALRAAHLGARTVLVTSSALGGMAAKYCRFRFEPWLMPPG